MSQRTPEPGFIMAERLQDHRATTTIDILDRVLDKGIVIDGWWKFYIGGLHLITVDARVVVASIETYLRHAPPVARTQPLTWPDVLVPMDTQRLADVPAPKKSRGGSR